jgi:hypothetical protein
MNFIPHVVEAVYIKDYLIEVRFNDGLKKKVNLETYTKKGGVFSALKDKEYFERFFIDLNTLCWPNGADVAPERLYEIGEEVLSEGPLAKV